MPNLSDLIGSGGKPKLITVYTSGTGTYIPLENNSRCLIRRQGAGGGGASASTAGGGGAGAFVESMERVPIAGISYSIGAGGVGVANATGTDGGGTVCGTLYAGGGRGSQSAGGDGAFIATGDESVKLGGVPGYSGGAGGNVATKGAAPGFSLAVIQSQNGSSTSTNNGGGGGDSFMGRGGNGAVNATSPGSDATGYGGGGGGAKGTAYKGGNGSGGYVEIWDYGV